MNEVLGDTRSLYDFLRTTDLSAECVHYSFDEQRQQWPLPKPSALAPHDPAVVDYVRSTLRLAITPHGLVFLDREEYGSGLWHVALAYLLLGFYPPARLGLSPVVPVDIDGEDAVTIAEYMTASARTAANEIDSHRGDYVDTVERLRVGY